MSGQQAPSGSAAAIIKAFEPTAEAVKTQGEMLTALKASIDTLESNHTMVQTQFEEIKATLDLILKAQTGVKKQIKPAEDKEPTTTTTTTTTTTPTPKAASGKGETELMFMTRMCKENATFKAKYGNDTIVGKCTEKNKKCKAHHVITTLPEYATLCAEFRAEYNASKNNKSETKAVETKDDLS